MISFTYCVSPNNDLRQRYPVSPHLNEDGFFNPHDPSPHGFSSVLKWKLGFARPDSVIIPAASVPEYLPIYENPDLDKIYQPDNDKIQLTWIGHSTFLVQVDGLNILTDPIFSERCSPFSFMGPKRVSRPGINLSDLPPLDLVLISHNHYDHLDAATIERLGNKQQYLVPLGLQNWFHNKGISRVTELDWWGEFALNANLHVHSVPAQHFSARHPFNRNKSLWCGYVIETRLGNIYFVGDSGYNPDFKRIGEKFNPIQLALIPIGAYNPRWFMRSMHLDPGEAVQVHLDVHSQFSVGMHWGTFKLTDEPLAEPPMLLRHELEQRDISPAGFQVMNFGQTLLLNPLDLPLLENTETNEYNSNSTIHKIQSTQN